MGAACQRVRGRALLVLVAVCAALLAVLRLPPAAAFAAPPLRGQAAEPCTQELPEAAVAARSPAAAASTDQPRSMHSPWRPLTVGVVFGILFAAATALAPAAQAYDSENGTALFNGICAGCHAGGVNKVVPDKALGKEALTKYKVFDVNRIKAIIAAGQNAMPAFGQLITPEDIDDLANYVYGQAEKGWKS